MKAAEGGEPNSKSSFLEKTTSPTSTKDAPHHRIAFDFVLSFHSIGFLCLDAML